MRRLFLAGVLAGAIGLTACGSDAHRVGSDQREGPAADQPSGPTAIEPSSTGKLQAVAAVYPLAFAVAEVGGNRISVTNLAVGKGEPHDLELTPRQAESMSKADLVVFLSGGFQPAVEKAAGRRPQNGLDALSVLGSQPSKSDPHIWLDPNLMGKIVSAVSQRLAELDPSGSKGYLARAGRMGAELRELDSQFQSGLRDCKRRDIVASHEAFGFLARRYSLNEVGLAGVSAEAEPTPRRLVEAARFAREQGVTTIFFEKAVSGDLAQTLAREVGIKAELLDPLESPPASGDYFSVMRRNLATLREALQCP